MHITTIFLAILALGTFVSTGVQLMIHFNAYPLIGEVTRETLNEYLSRFERTLQIPLNAPVLLTAIGAIAMFVLHPTQTAVIGAIAAFLSVVVIGIVTFAAATPIYNRVKEGNSDSKTLVSRLTAVNTIRLVSSLLGSAAIFWVLIQTTL